MADKWLTQIQTNQHLQEPEPQAVTKIIHDVAVHQISPSEAAKSISSDYKSAFKPKCTLWSLWTIIIDAIRNLGGDEDVSKQFAQTLLHLSNLPDVLDENGQALKVNSGRKIWSDLPDFSFYFFEQGLEHVMIEQIEISRFGVTVEAAAQKLLNANTFAALYLLELDPHGPANEFSSMRKLAKEHFMYTLEIPFDTPEQVRRTQTYIPPAAGWIAIAGRNLYRYCKSNTDYRGEDVEPWWIGGQYGGTVMWDKRDGFSVVRWTFWKERFETFSKLQGADEGLKAQAAKAAQQMKDIEEGERD